jgi:hypothetical protein
VAEQQDTQGDLGSSQWRSRVRGSGGRATAAAADARRERSRVNVRSAAAALHLLEASGVELWLIGACTLQAGVGLGWLRLEVGSIGGVWSLDHGCSTLLDAAYSSMNS